MEKINVLNMPKNILYEISPGRYVWKIDLYSTRNEEYKSRTPVTYTEVYEKGGNNSLSRIVSGKLINNPHVFDYNKEFAVFDYEKDTDYTFEVKYFKEAPLEAMYLLKDLIIRETKMHTTKK